MANLSGRPPYKKTGKAKAKPKRMRQVSEKRAAYRRSDIGKLASLYMSLVKMLPCCVSGVHGPCDVHHCFHDRFGTRKASDFDVIPLSKQMHQDGPDAIHNGKAAWREKHGPDHAYIEQTRFAVLQMVDEKTHDLLVAAFFDADAEK